MAADCLDFHGAPREVDKPLGDGDESCARLAVRVRERFPSGTRLACSASRWCLTRSSKRCLALCSSRRACSTLAAWSARSPSSASWRRRPRHSLRLPVRRGNRPARAGGWRARRAPFVAAALELAPRRTRRIARRARRAASPRGLGGGDLRYRGLSGRGGHGRSFRSSFAYKFGADEHGSSQPGSSRRRPAAAGGWPASRGSSPDSAAGEVVVSSLRASVAVHRASNHSRRKRTRRPSRRHSTRSWLPVIDP